MTGDLEDCLVGFESAKHAQQANKMDKIVNDLAFITTDKKLICIELRNCTEIAPYTTVRMRQHNLRSKA